MSHRLDYTVASSLCKHPHTKRLQGHVICDPHQPLEIDTVEGRIHGEVLFQPPPKTYSAPPKTRVLIDEKAQLWRFQTVGEMLGMDDCYDENQNMSQNCSQPSGSSTFTSSATFPIRVMVPKFAPPSFHCPGSPVNVRFSLEVSEGFMTSEVHLFQILLYNQGFKVASHEENLVVLNYESVKKGVQPKPVNFQKTFHFPK